MGYTVHHRRVGAIKKTKNHDFAISFLYSNYDKNGSQLSSLCNILKIMRKNVKSDFKKYHFLLNLWVEADKNTINLVCYNSKICIINVRQNNKEVGTAIWMGNTAHCYTNRAVDKITYSGIIDSSRRQNVFAQIKVIKRLIQLRYDERRVEVEKNIQDDDHIMKDNNKASHEKYSCLLYTSPSPRDRQKSRMPSSA